MRIKLGSVLVEDQDKALRFYTDVLGFVKKSEFSLGQYRWLTVVSPDGPGDIELLLEPNDNPAAKAYQKALFEQGIPLAAFQVDDIHAEHERLKGRGVVFRSPPTRMGETTQAMFEDTCGNVIQIYQS